MQRFVDKIRSLFQAKPEPEDPRALLDLPTLATDRRNLSFNYDRELLYWRNEIAARNEHILERCSTSPESRNQCPWLVEDAVRRAAQALGRKPRVLELGAGPFSSLVFLVRHDLAEVVATDALAEEFARLLADATISYPVTPVCVLGEFLDQLYPSESFDITFVSNALDHCLCPAVAWYNMLKLTRVGGFVIHCHAVREGTHQKQEDLHQFDLWPENNGLMISDLAGHEFSLTEGLPLECEHLEVIPADGPDGWPWFAQSFTKTAALAASASFLEHCLRDLLRAFQSRNAWALYLERRINASAHLASQPGHPYSIPPESAEAPSD